MPPKKRKLSLESVTDVDRLPPHQVANLLMIPVNGGEPVTRPKTIQATKEVVNGSFHAYLCPKCGAESLKEKGQGYGRPFSHMKSCYGSTLLPLYQKASKMALMGHPPQEIINLMRAAGATTKERAIADWISLIVDKSLPLNYVEDPCFLSR